MASRNLFRVRRAKHSKRTDGRRNWIVEDLHDGTELVYATFPAAIGEADRLARRGLVNPYGLVGCYSPAMEAMF